MSRRRVFLKGTDLNAAAHIAFEPSREALLRRAGFDSPAAFLQNPAILRAGGTDESTLGAAYLPARGGVLFVARREACGDRALRRLVKRASAPIENGAGAGAPVLLLPLAAWGWGEDGSGRRVFFSAAAAPAGTVCLDRRLRAEPDRIGAILDALADLAASLHAAGRRCGHLCSWCVASTPGGALVVADPLAVPEAQLRRSYAAFRRSYAAFRRSPGGADLAALSATIEAPLVSWSNRLRLVAAYARSAGGAAADRRTLHRFWKGLLRAERPLRRRGFFPETFDRDDLAEEGGRGQIARADRPILASLGLRALRDFVEPPAAGARLLRDTGDRRNYAAGAPQVRYFLKVHRAAGAAVARSPGRREWLNTLRLIRCGLPAAAPAAWGEWNGQSFFVSRDDGGVPADDVLRAAGPDSAAARRRMARELGALVGAFHRAGFFHRDLYLCHLLRREPRTVLIDVQRMEDGFFWERRGRIKDLAALYYSSLATPATRSDRMCFFKTYLQTGPDRLRGPLPPAGRRLAAAVTAKARRIAAHAARRAAPPPAGRSVQADSSQKDAS